MPTRPCKTVKNPVFLHLLWRTVILRAILVPGQYLYGRAQMSKELGTVRLVLAKGEN